MRIAFGISNSFLFLALLLFFYQHVAGQSCGTLGDPAKLILPPSNYSGSLCYPDQPGPYHLKVYLHVLLKDDYSGGVTLNAINQSLQILEEDFGPHNIFFYRACEEIDSIPNTTLYESATTTDLNSQCQVFGINAHSDGIDIYYARPTLGGGAAEDTPSLAYIIGGQEAATGTFSHEMGHCLGLYHTHHECEDGFINEDCQGNSSVIQSFPEIPASGDCFSGDYVDDTPRDFVQCDDDHQQNCPGGQMTCNLSVFVENCTFTGFGLSPDVENIMSYTDIECRNHLTEGQGLRARYIIAESPVLKSLHEPLLITDDETWPDVYELQRSIIIKSGATLTVTGTVKMPYFGAIVVERGARLVVDGGTLTRNCFSDYWSGVIVQGHADKLQPDPFGSIPPDEAGAVVLTNNATLEWAETGISANFSNDFNGGVINAQNSNFLNNIRSVDIGRYNFTNRSRFLSCDFINGSWGISISETDGVGIHNCSFQSVVKASVTLIDAGAGISNNQFSGSFRAIESFATHPFTAETSISSNQFSGNNMHIWGLATSQYDGIGILNNTFGSAINTGIRLVGPCLFFIEGNSFTNQNDGVDCRSTGDYTNYIYNNNFDGMNRGIYVTGDNPLLLLSCNDFLNTNTDVHLRSHPRTNETGAINETQAGLFGSVAGNCFGTSSADIITEENTKPFTYYVPLSNTSACKYIPVDNLSDGGSNNYFLIIVDIDPSIPEPIICGFQREHIDIPGCPNIVEPFEEEDLHCVRSQLAISMANLLGDPGNDSLLRLHTDLLATKDFLLNLLVSEAIDSNDIATATNLLIEDSTLQADKKLLGLKYETADFAGAQALVNSFPSVTQDEIWYRDIQNINIIRLQQDTFVLDSLQEALLYEVAESDSYNRAYARALLALLKGERIEDDDSPGQGGGQTAEQQPEDMLQQMDSKVKIMPNPAKDEIYIVWQESPAEDQQLCVFDWNGKIVRSLRLPAGTAQLRLNIADLPNGIYYLHIEGAAMDSRVIRKFVVHK